MAIAVHGIKYGKRFGSFLAWCRLTGWLPDFLCRNRNGNQATMEKIVRSQTVISPSQAHRNGKLR